MEIVHPLLFWNLFRRLIKYFFLQFQWILNLNLNLNQFSRLNLTVIQYLHGNDNMRMYLWHMNRLKVFETCLLYLTLYSKWRYFFLLRRFKIYNSKKLTKYSFFKNVFVSTQFFSNKYIFESPPQTSKWGEIIIILLFLSNAIQSWKKDNICMSIEYIK